jgi:3-oxoacyl-[acyl-carrier-protein] synthase II
MRVQREDRRWICILVIDIDFFANQARPMAMDYAISNGFGFGGVNASALFRRWTDERTGASAGGGS